MTGIAGRLEPARRQSESLRATSHRPWPPPAGRWILGQTWRALAFLHWPVRPEELRPLVPAALALDRFDGRAWLGITPFEVVGHRLRGVPPLPVLSRFEELNVRTYATLDGRPGIHFLSLDAASLAAVLGARATYRLPYFPARMAMSADAGGGGVRYRSERLAGPAARLVADYAPTGPAFTAVPGTLEHWLTERYRLYTADRRGRPRHADIHHAPWPLQPARADIVHNTMADWLGLPLRGEPHVLFAPRQDVVIWPLHRADAGAQRAASDSGVARAPRACSESSASR
jgi:uncharacterized protein YqjF (DUF2071 family)